jgi:acetate kinase
MPQETVLTSGIVERIGFDDAIFSIKFNDEKVKKVLPIHDHKEAVQMVLDALVAHRIVENLDEIKGVGHRVVHGGELYANSVVADEKVEKDIEDLADLAPLHNPANLIGYRAFAKSLPHARHAMVFDTAFHQTMAPDIYLYPIPFEYYQHYKIRRYGFHGTSHYFVSRQTAKQMGKNVEDINIITCHLGNGASITAIEKGRSVNTSMGFTPLAGIMMGTRSGDIDPAIITFLMKKLGKTAEQVIDILNKKSGMLGVSQLSSDARDIEKAVEEGNEQAILTRKIYANRIAQTIGSYYMQMGSVDAIVFTGGLGENDFGVRADITQRVEKALGIQFDYALNAKSRGKDVKLSLEGSKVDVWMISTNEELVIAQDTSRLLGF